MSSVFRVGCELRGKLDTIAQSYKLNAVTVTLKCYVSVMPYNCHLERITFFYVMLHVILLLSCA